MDEQERCGFYMLTLEQRKALIRGMCDRENASLFSGLGKSPPRVTDPEIPLGKVSGEPSTKATSEKRPNKGPLEEYASKQA